MLWPLTDTPGRPLPLVPGHTEFNASTALLLQVAKVRGRHGNDGQVNSWQMFSFPTGAASPPVWMLFFQDWILTARLPPVFDRRLFPRVFSPQLSLTAACAIADQPCLNRCRLRHSAAAGFIMPYFYRRLRAWFGGGA